MTREYRLSGQKVSGKIDCPKLTKYGQALNEGDNESHTRLVMNCVDPDSIGKNIRSPDNYKQVRQNILKGIQYLIIKKIFIISNLLS